MQFPDSKLMTEKENRWYDLVTQVYNDFLELDEPVFGIDAQKVAELTNDLKSIIMSRPVLREFYENDMYEGLSQIKKVDENG